MSKQKVFWIIGLTACAPFALAQGIDKATVLIGWRSALSKVESLDGYEIDGSRKLELAKSIRGGASPDIEWKTKVSGKRYRTAWSNSPKVTREQSFDGDTWYGLTQSPEEKAGIICKNPEKSVEANLDEQLSKQAAGGFYPRLSDLVERPMNLGGVSILQGYEGVDRFVSLTLKGDQVTLSLPEEQALKSHLPVEVTLTMYEDAFYPTKLRAIAKGASGVSEDVMVLSDYQKLGAVYYPQKVVETVSQRDQKKSVPLITANYRINAKTYASQSAKDFQIAFPKNTRIFDDREPLGARAQKVRSSWDDTKGYVPIAAIGTLVLIGGTLYAVRSRRKVTA